jgi:class 3 adenylate cyclase
VLPETDRFVASKIPSARVVEHSSQGGPHFHWYGRGDAIVGEVRRVLAEIGEEEASVDRILATILFTDIVDSTKRAAELEDRRWSEVVLRHHATVRTLLARYRGIEIDTSGDGCFASFDGPARAVRCAIAITDAVRALGIEVRAGLHTGEVERIGEKIGGIAVNIGARVAARAAPSEVLVSQTVRDLMVGSDVRRARIARDEGSFRRVGSVRASEGRWRPRLAHPAGVMFGFRRKKLSGSYFFFSAAKRS